MDKKTTRIDSQKFGLDAIDAPFTQLTVSVRTTKLSSEASRQLVLRVLSSLGAKDQDWIIESLELKSGARRDKPRSQNMCSYVVLLPVLERNQPRRPDSGDAAGRGPDASTHPNERSIDNGTNVPAEGAAQPTS